MTQKDFSKLIEAVKIVEEFGFAGLEEALALIMNEAMKSERSRALGAESYERTESRKGYANGYKPKTVNSRLGRLELEKWRNRPLGERPYVQFDARYENVRIDGSVVSAATLVAIGIRKDGKRTVLGVSTSISEAEIHWRTFLESLVRRGLHGIKMMTSDACRGLKTAMKAVFTGVPWTRCHVHLQRNSFKYVPKVDMREKVARTISNILTAPDLFEAKRLLEKAVNDYEKKAPKLAEWMSENIPEGFAVFQLNPKLRRKLRSTNLIERLNREIKRRTRVSTLFPNEESLLRLVSAILMEQSEEWEAGDRYLILEGCSV